MIEEEYLAFVLVVALVALVAGGSFLVRRHVLSKAKPMERRPSVLAERMAAVRRTHQSESPEGGRPAARRQRLSSLGTIGSAAGGGGGVRPLSKRSFLQAGGESPGERSPLLGEKEPQVSFAGAGGGGGDEKKEALADWGDMEGARSGGSEFGSESGSRRTTASAALTTLSAADEALLRTFMDVLAEGLPIKIHRRSSKRPRNTTIWLKDNDTLVWVTKRAVGTKQWHKLDLRGVTSVQAGKGSADGLIIGSGEAVEEIKCFCLTFRSVTMGFEAASELERDALVQGFVMLVDDLKAEDNERRLRDAELGATKNI